ncbi:S1C family serine protease [Humitalea sp. 24SJ18S-53]|uniref:S1C family serine protease n=1 Tax=Humitalea sp. 24SJ18S-53 TaxID=3422307 RepID=UPI003D678B70
MTRSIRRQALAAMLLGATALGGVGAVFLPNAFAQGLPSATSIAPRAGAPASFADLVEQVSPSVVRIAIDGGSGASPARRGAPAPDADPEGRRGGQGSGFIIDADGLIVTNFHVAGRAENITVTLADGTVLPAKLVGGDERTDLAVLRVDAGRPLPAVPFATGTPPRVGDWVVAVGNPFGLGLTVTSGIVSARGRDIGAGPYDDFLQTDTAINPGNSGGPLFDMQGRVVGVNTAILSPSGASAGIGFAVPAEVAARVAGDLREHGRVARGWLGVETAPALAANGRPAPGARLANVMRDGPAARAGLLPGDVVTRVDDTQINDGRALARALGARAPGSEVTLAIQRGQESKTIRATIGDQPSVREAAAQAEPAPTPRRRAPADELPNSKQRR